MKFGGRKTVSLEELRGRPGIPYSVIEIRAACENNRMDVYHRELLLWAADEIDRLKADKTP